MALNLPFEIPEPCGQFYETLSEEVQELLFRNYYSHFKSEIQAGEGHAIENYIFEIETLESVLKDGDYFEITNCLQGEEIAQTIERTNPITGEKILVKERNIDQLTDEAARAELAEEIARRRDFLNSSADVRVNKFWLDEIETFYESSLFGAASNLTQLSKVIDDYKRHALVQDVISRARRANLHEDYAAEAIKCRGLYDEAEELNRQGDSSHLEALRTLGAEALVFKSQGRRITSEGGPCYICGKFVWPHNGELLIWSEIPKHVREKYIPDVFQKWHIRHFGPECSRPEFGKRDFFLHPKGPFAKKNAKPDKCIVCDANVPAESGWLIPVSLVPKWKQARPAFPGAKTKNYYVSCGKED